MLTTWRSSPRLARVVDPARLPEQGAWGDHRRLDLNVD